MSSSTMESPLYQCRSEDQVSCAETCVSLWDCQSCGCVVLTTDVGGAWGDVLDVLFCLAPIMFLVYATVKPRPLPTTTSLPLAALFMYAVRLAYLKSNVVLTTGAVILGLHEATTPLSIMAGAIALFETMEATGCLPYMVREMKDLTAGHPVAELMLLFCFAYMVEGASGFGTPVALSAPILVSTGNPPMESIVTMLICNTFATVWGAVGTPIWFGLGSLGLSNQEFLDVSFKAGVALATSANLLMPFVLQILVPWSVVRKNLVFVYASLATCVGPSLAISAVSFEFPSLLGGILGCAGTACLIRFRVGLTPLDDADRAVLAQRGDNGSNSSRSRTDDEDSADVPTKKLKEQGSADVEFPQEQTNPVKAILQHMTSSFLGDDASRQEPVANEDREEGEPLKRVLNDNDNDDGFDVLQLGTTGRVAVEETSEDRLGPRKAVGEGYILELIGRTFPLWGVVLILILTRVEEIGIKEHLTSREPYFSIHLGTYGTFRLSSSVVFQLRDILTYPSLNFKYELFYIPFLVPFVLVSVLTMILYRNDMKVSPQDIATTVVGRLSSPATALVGALALVQLMIRSGDEAPANILGTILSDWFKEAFVVLTPLMGALGSFFSGSTTVSNLTFGNIQLVAAETIGASATSLLALQAVGGAAGAGICLNSIIAACAVVGLNIGEGQILVQTYKFVFASTTIATTVMLAFFLRFDA